MSNVYRGRRVPDLSGLVGMSAPSGNLGAMYIMLPLEPGDRIDQGQHNNGANHYRSAGATAPYGDETGKADGWGVFSGTSAAAPQIAGAAALVKQVYSRLSPARVRRILMRTARDVTAGNCSPRTGENAAVAGPDTATGYGLVNAYKAVVLAKIERMRIIWPIPMPIQPIPIQPVLPRPIPTTNGGDYAVETVPSSDVSLTEEDFQLLEELALSSDFIGLGI